MVHYVLVMSVNPGFGGQKFLPLAIDKIAHLAELRGAMGLNFRIEVDGGVAHGHGRVGGPRRGGHAGRGVRRLRQPRPRPSRLSPTPSFLRIARAAV